MSLSTELTARMPWTAAREGSYWIVSGDRGPKRQHTFTDCLARALPRFITESDTPVFEVLCYFETYAVPASYITAGREVFLVKATDPLTAENPDDQATITAALDRIGGAA